MKELMKWVFVLLLIVTLPFCGKDSNSTAPIVNQLLGRWKEEGANNYFTFLTDGTFYYTYAFGTPKGPYTVKGDTLILASDDPDWAVNGTAKYIFKVEDGLLLLTYISEGRADGPTFYKKE